MCIRDSDPVDLRVLEDLDHVDVDEVDAKLHAFDAALLHFLLDRVGELRHLLGRCGAGGALDPRVRITDIFLGDPRRMLLDVQADVAPVSYTHLTLPTSD